MPSRPQVAPTEDWRQIELLARAPGQRTYELIRPVVLFGQSPAERAAETGAAERTLYRQVARFDQLGMASLLPPPKVEKHRTLPPNEDVFLISIDLIYNEKNDVVSTPDMLFLRWSNGHHWHIE